jgi:Domain of unknown function (DUF5753)
MHSHAVTLQALPFDAAAHASMGTSFELLHFRGPETPPSSTSKTTRAANAWRCPPTSSDIPSYLTHLTPSALAPGRSVEFIDQVAST